MNIYNYYRYIGLDPIFKSFNQKQLQFDPAILKNCKIGSYLNRAELLDEDRDDFEIKQLRFEMIWQIFPKSSNAHLKLI